MRKYSNHSSESTRERRSDLGKDLSPLIWLVAVLMAIVLLMLLGGCRSRPHSPTYIPVESTVMRGDTFQLKEKVCRNDSTVVTERIYEIRLDSIAPILDSTGRMIGFDRWHIVDRSINRTSSGRSSLIRIDTLKTQGVTMQTIREPFPVEQTVRVNTLHWWQKALIAIGGLTLIVIAVGVWRRFRK